MRIPVSWSSAAAVVLIAAAAGAVEVKVGTKFDHWTAGCEALPDGKGEHCFIFQRLMTLDSGAELGSVAVGYPKPGAQPLAVLNLPLGMLLPEGVSFSIEGRPVRSYPIEFCRKDGCRAYMPIDAGMLDAMKKGLTAEITFQDLARRKISLPISLKGFTRALASLG